jgi:hypothetical protein
MVGQLIIGQVGIDLKQRVTARAFVFIQRNVRQPNPGVESVG